MKKIICLIILVIPGALSANISMPYAPSSGSGDMYINQANNLRVVTETISYDISRKDFSAVIDVQYTIKNDGRETFTGPMFFIASEYMGYNGEASGFRVKVNGKSEEFTRTDGVKIDNPGAGNDKLYSGFTFNVSVSPGATLMIEVRYTQIPGFSRRDGGATVAAMSHYINLYTGPSPAARVYSYQIFPIKSFGGGVDEIIIKIKYPVTDSEGNSVDDPDINVPISGKTSNNEYYVMEQRFSSIPADTLDILLNVSTVNRFGFTVTPLYIFDFPGKDNTWAGSVSLDCIIEHERVSAGVMWDFNDRVQLFQDVRFFPRSYAYYMDSCIDFRLGLGIAEQLKPDPDLGFRIIAGVRIFFALECVYQVFPPWLSGGWDHQLIVSVPFSF